MSEAALSRTPSHEATGDLLAAESSFADLLSDQEHYAEAISVREKVLALARRLVGLRPGELEAQRTLAVAEKRLGALYGVSGRYRECRDAYQSAQAIDEQLYRLNASDQRTRLDLSYDYSDLGWVAARLGSYEQALESHRRALALRTEAAAADPNDFRAAVWWPVAPIASEQCPQNGESERVALGAAAGRCTVRGPRTASRRRLEHVRSLAETRGDEAETLPALGGRGNLDRAMAAYQRALRADIRLRDQGVLPGAAAASIGDPDCRGRRSARPRDEAAARGAASTTDCVMM